MHTNIKILFLFILKLHSMYSFESDNYLSDLRTSVIIPCSFKHANLLHPLLKHYEKQTILPDEIVISLSEVNQVSSLIIKRLQAEPWDFPVKLLLSDQKLFAGENRNKACQNAIGDIFVCQDADDIPHPQRIEIIKYFFENYDVDHLMHLFVFPDELESFLFYDLDKISFLHSKSKDLNHIWKLIKKFHNGNIAISRHVFEKIQWTNRPTGQDVNFNEEVYKNFTKCFVIMAPLMIYHRELSSWKN